MGQWTKQTGLNIALFFLVVYSLRSDVAVKANKNGDFSSSGSMEGRGGRRRSTTTTTTPPPVFSSSTGASFSFSSPSPVWRRRPMIHRRQQSMEGQSTTTSTTEPSSGPMLDQLPDDFINLASNSAADFTSHSGGANSPFPLTSSFYPTTGTGQKILADPFMLSGDDNILGPTPSEPRRKVFRRTRRRRIKKLRAGGDISSTSPSAPASTTTEEDGEVATGEEFGSSTTASASTEILNRFKLMTSSSTTSTLRPQHIPSKITTMKLSVVPIDSLQGQTEEISTEGNPSPLFLPTTGPTAIHNIKPGYYTPKYANARKRAKSKENLWKATSPNFSVELFDNTDATDEQPNSNLDKRESSSKKNPAAATQVFAVPLPKPTGLSGLLSSPGDQSTGESIQSPFVNTSLPISTELQNSLQFTLQVLHPLLNSDSVLTQKEPKIPENKTVAITHSLAESPAETPIAPDLRFLPAHLRKSHPLLSQEIFFDGGGGVGVLGGKKVGSRFNAQPGLHSIRNPSTGTTSTFTLKPNSSTSTRKTIPTSTIPSTRKTTPYSTIPSTVRVPSTSTIKAYSSNSSPPSSAHVPPPANVHLEGLGNLKITEIVYPTNSVPKEGPSLTLSKGYSAPPPRGSSTTSTSSTTAATTSKSVASTTKLTTSTAKSTTTTTTQKVTSTSKLPTSGRPTPIFDHVDQKTPPLILMGSDSTMGSAIESPPAFDDLLLEELIKGFEPPTPSTTPTTTTTTTTTSTTTTPRPSTTRFTPRITTTTTPKPHPPPPLQKLPAAQDDETQQLLTLLNILQGQSNNQPVPSNVISSSTTSSTTEAIKHTSSSTLSPTTPKLDDEFLKQLALLESLLSPTAKTMIKQAVDTGTTEKIKGSSASNQPGLSNSDLHQIFQLLDAMSTTPKPIATTTTTTTPKPQVIHPALQNMLNLLTNPSQAAAAVVPPQKPLFSIPEPPKPVPTSSSFDLLSQLFNLNAASATTQKPISVANTLASGLTGLGGALGGLFDSFLPKKTPQNRDAGASPAASNPLLSFFQTPNEPVVTPAPGPYYWFDVNAFLGQDPNAGPMSGIRPKFGTRDYFLKVRRRRNSMEMY